MRSNLVIALGDLAVRFPNVLEPWTAKMYCVLEDPHAGAPFWALHAAIMPSVWPCLSHWLPTRSLFEWICILRMEGQVGGTPTWQA